MSSSGHSVRSESANSPTVASSLAVSCCASSPMMPMNRSRAALSMSGNAAIVSIGRADAAERGTCPLRQRLQQQIAAIARFDAPSDVVENQHEPGDAAGSALCHGIARRPEHRRHLHPDQQAGGCRGHEVRGRATRALGEALVDGLQRVDDEVAVEDREYRTAQSDEAVRLAGRSPALQRLPEELHRAGVVEQDAALDIAHDHALRELRHQCREAVPFLLDAGIGFAHAPRHVLLQRLVGIGEAALNPSPSRRISADPAGAARCDGFAVIMMRISSASRRGAFDIAAEQCVQDEDERREQQQRHHDQARGTLGEHREQHRALVIGEVGADEKRGSADGGEDEAPRGQAARRRSGAGPTSATRPAFPGPWRSGPWSRTAWSRRRPRRPPCLWSPRRRVPWPTA